MADNYDDLQEQEELNEVKADINAENNARQLNARMLISRKSEINRSKGLAEDGGEEMTGVDDGVPDDDLSGGMTDAYPYSVTDDQIKSALAGLPPAKDVPTEQKFKLKVNGKELELTQEELIARAQKVEAADQYLAEAKRQAESLRSQPQIPSSQPEAESQPDTLSDEDLALARALQVGSEEDAARAIASIRRKASQQPSSNLDVVVKKVEEDLEFKQNVKWFQENYKEIFADPDYLTLAMKRDDEIRREEVEKGLPPSSYRDRYQRIGDDIRKKFGIDPGFSEKTRQKKETLTNIPQASVKQRAVVEEDDSEESPATVIANMAKARGQLRI